MNEKKLVAVVVIGAVSLCAILSFGIIYRSKARSAARAKEIATIANTLDNTIAKSNEFAARRDFQQASAALQEFEHKITTLGDPNLEGQFRRAMWSITEAEQDYEAKLKQGYSVFEGRFISNAEKNRILAERKAEEDRRVAEEGRRVAERQAEEERRIAVARKQERARRRSEEEAKRKSVEDHLREKEDEIAPRKAQFAAYLEAIIEWRDKQFNRLSDDTLLPTLELLYFDTEGLRFCCGHPLEVGRLGFFDSVKIIQVVDGLTVLVSYEFKCLKRVGSSIVQTTEDVKTLMIKGFNTRPFVDGEDLDLSGRIMEIAEPTSYTTVLGAKKKVFVAQPFDLSDLEKYATEFTDPDLWLKQLTKGGE